MTEPNPDGRDVSMPAVSLYVDYVESRGLRPADLLDGTGLSVERLTDRTAWVDQATMNRVEDRLSSLFASEPDVHFAAGTSVGDAKIPFMGPLMRSVLSPMHFYRTIPRVVPKFLFRRVQVTTKQTRRNTMLVRYVFDDGFPPTRGWIETNRGTLIGLPVKMGFRAPSVEARRLDPLTVEYQITLDVEWLGVIDFVQRGVHRVIQGVRRRMLRVDSWSAIYESNRLLAEKVDDLEATRRELDARVRHLSVLKAISEATVKDLDVRGIIERAVEVAFEELGVPLWIATCNGPDAPPDVAHAGLDAQVLAAIGAALCETDCHADAPPAGLARIGEVHRLVARGRVLGVMVLRLDASTDPALRHLFESISHQIAAAVDNATSYAEVHRLREHLEIRVHERTAELEEARGRLQHLVEKLQTSERSVRDFFTNVSHEFRTPLTLITAPLAALAARMQAEGDAEGARSISRIQRNAHALLRMINEILDFARLDADQMPVHPARFELIGVLAELVDSLQSMADEAGVDLQIDLPAFGVRVHADPRLLRRAFGNLIINAIKYVEAGDSITVSVATGAADWVVIEVRDTGPGIPADRHEQVFERFKRLEDGEGNRATGTGIGLSMVRGIVELHGGKIALRANEPRGCRFVTELPVEAFVERRSLDAEPSLLPIDAESLLDVAQFGTPATEVAAPAHRDAPRLLLVEDNAEMRQFLADLLAPHFRVSVARDGVEALGSLAESLPDLILSDVQMPRLDGYRLCAAVKADPTTRQLPVVLISAMHGTEASVRGFDAGADDFVVKPFSPPELLARLHAQVRIRQLQCAVIEMERQHTMGTIAGGIAHEVLNPVNAVLVAIKPLRDRMVDVPPAAREVADKLVDIIERSGERIRDVVQAVLAISRQDGLDAPRRWVRVGDLLDTVTTILTHRLHGVTLHRALPENDVIRCVPELVSQVLMNLVGNAIDAMPDGGTVTVEMIHQAGEIQVRVRDTGVGLPEGELDRLFVPFFTTKPPGSGTGLGLAISREIAELHGGRLTAESQRGGATFILSLPVGDAPESTAPTAPGIAHAQVA